MTDNKGPIQRAYHQVVAGQFMRWWLGELESLVPSWLRAGKNALDGVARFSQGELEAASGDLVSGRGAGAVLEVPSSKVLRRSVRLPIATEENLRQVLEFQMEQYTPFTAGQLYFSHSVLARDFDKGLIEVELVAVQRVVVDAAIQRLKDADYAPVAVHVADGRGGVLSYDLLPTQAGARPSVWRNGPVVWLLALVLILAIAALALPLFIQREAAIQLIPLVERSKQAAEAVDGVARVVQHREEPGLLLRGQAVADHAVDEHPQGPRRVVDDVAELGVLAVDVADDVHDPLGQRQRGPQGGDLRDRVLGGGVRRGQGFEDGDAVG